MDMPPATKRAPRSTALHLELHAACACPVNQVSSCVHRDNGCVDCQGLGWWRCFVLCTSFQGGLSLHGHRPYCDQFHRRTHPGSPGSFQLVGPLQQQCSAATTRTPQLTPRHPKTQRSTGAEEPETTLRETSIPFRRDQTARAEPRYFLLAIVFGHRPTENLLSGAGTRISAPFHHSFSSSLILTAYTPHTVLPPPHRSRFFPRWFMPARPLHVDEFRREQ